MVNLILFPWFHYTIIFLWHIKHEHRKHIVNASQVVLKELNLPRDLNLGLLSPMNFNDFKGSGFADGYISKFP